MAKAFDKDTGGTLTTNLISWYNFESDSTDEFGTINGTETSITHPAGKIGNAAEFNAQTDKIDFGNNFDVTTGPFSISAWFKFTTAIAGNYPLIIGKSNYDGVSDWEVRFVNGGGTIQFGLYGPSLSDVITTVTDYKDNTWHHIVAYRNGTNIKIRIDDATETSGTDNARNVSNALSAGIGQMIANHGYSQCLIDLVGVWSKALSAQEITDLHNGGNGNAYRTQPSSQTLMMAGVGS